MDPNQASERSKFVDMLPGYRTLNIQHDDQNCIFYELDQFVVLKRHHLLQLTEKEDQLKPKLFHDLILISF